MRPLPPWLLPVGILLVAFAVLALALLGHGHKSFVSRAQAICNKGQSERAKLPENATTPAQGLGLIKDEITSLGREVAGLKRLTPPATVARPYRVAVADEDRLVRMGKQVIARPDFTRLATTLPGHPELMPAWLKQFLAESQLLVAGARRNFTRVPGLAGCARSFG